MPQLWGARNEILKGRVGLNSIWKVNPLGGLLTRSLTKVASGIQGAREGIIALSSKKGKKINGQACLKAKKILRRINLFCPRKSHVRDGKGIKGQGNCRYSEKPKNQETGATWAIALLRHLLQLRSAQH